MIVVVLNIICTFVKSTQLRRNLKLNFFNDKEPLTSLAATKVPLPVLDCVDKTDGVVPRTNNFLMSTEKQFVSNSQCAALTPAQKRNEKNQQTLNGLIIQFVQLCLDNSTIIKGPIRKEYLEIYNESLKPAAL